MHLDTVLTMIDVDTFVRYPGLDVGTLRSWVITPADPEEVVERNTGGLHVEHRGDLSATIADALGVENLRVLVTNEDAWAAQHEQWDDEAAAATDGVRPDAPAPFLALAHTIGSS